MRPVTEIRERRKRNCSKSLSGTHHGSYLVCKHQSEEDSNRGDYLSPKKDSSMRVT